MTLHGRRFLPVLVLVVSPSFSLAQEPAPQQKKQNPFETVLPPDEAKGSIADVIEAVEFRGSRRVPQETLRTMIVTRKGDKLDLEALHRDFMSLWNSNRFDDITLQREPGQTGWIVRFLLSERRVIRSIKYEGNKSITLSEILDRFKDRRVGLSIESQYDPNKIQRATNVLKEYLAERGRQYATVAPEIRQVPPSSLEVMFKIEEGPKVKVGNIAIEGNHVFSDRAVRAAMKNLRPIGVPRSILFENLFAKTFDSTKLEEDKDRIRDFYQQRGYFTARALDHTVTMRDIGGGKFRVPLVYTNKPGKRADLVIQVEEGRKYRLNKITLTGMKLFRTPETLMGPLFQMSEGDVFSTAKLRKGLENMRKLYGQFGYIDFVTEPVPEIIPNSDKIDLTLNIDEGRQFFVRRIEFSGNTTTRDKVIRRELLIDEGDVFNSTMWEVSLLRLNQLGYFEPLKENEAASMSRDTKTNTIDLNLKVKERGKNSVQLNGGVSGVAGSFVGFSYSTNNFLGLGETLSVSSQIGDRVRDITFGFTEPYFLDRPIQTGFTVYRQRFNFDQGRELSIFSGGSVGNLADVWGKDNVVNYVSNGEGFTVFASTQLKRSFARVGITYGYNVSHVTPLTKAAEAQFQTIDFLGLSSQSQLAGIRTSQIIPSYTYNTVDHPITPTKGKSLFLSTAISGAFLGGNVNTIQPTVDAKYFHPGLRRGHVVGGHVLGRFITGFDGKGAPPMNRFLMGGEQDIRGFENWQVGPHVYVPFSASVDVLNSDGSARTQKVVDANGVTSYVPVTQSAPAYQRIYPGGDTQVITNFEYRIPIVGPVTLAAFLDAGVNRITRPGQLVIRSDQLATLNAQFPQAGFGRQALIAPGTQAMRMSTGLELQVMLPVVNAPFRIYWAYNPRRVEQNLPSPLAIDPSMFNNQATFLKALDSIGRPFPLAEKASTFRFTIGRTF